MVNFLQHKTEVIQDFCDTFKKSAWKDIWGISLNCNVKPPEEVWFNKELLEYQELSADGCASGCTLPNPSFVITEYAKCTGISPFPCPFAFNPNKLFCTSTGEGFTVCGGCCTNITLSTGSTVRTYNFTVTNNAASITEPISGYDNFTYIPLIGFNIQLSLSGYGFFNPGTQYLFDTNTGKITLLGGLLFNYLEVYTIFAYK